jgi:hypothetical protein
VENGIYIYGIIKASSAREFGAIGISEPASNVQTINFKDIAAVISQNPFVHYDSLAKEKTVKDLIMHQLVIEKVMTDFTIAPVKFGTMVKTEDEVIAFLQKGHALLSDQLSKMEGKIELDVVANWELPKFMAQLRSCNSQIQRKQQEIAQKGDKVSIEDRIALGKLIEPALQAEKARHNQMILQALAKEAIEVCSHELIGDEMIFNAAFLLAKEKEQAFNDLITALDRDLENTVNFRMVGPLPPYSFSTIVLESIDPSRLEEARKLFGLDGEITEKTVRDAYRQLAQKTHPDKNKGKSTTFPLINAAYKTLKNFAASGLMRVEVYRWEKDLQ